MSTTISAQAPGRTRLDLPPQVWLMALFFAVLPLLNREVPIVGGSLVLPVAMLVALTALAPAVRAGFAQSGSLVLLSAGAYVALRIAGVLRHDDVFDAARASLLPLTALVAMLGVAALLWVARDQGNSEDVTQLLFAGLLIAGLISSAAALLLRQGPLSAVNGGSVIENRASGLFGQPNELGGWSAMAMVLAAALLAADQQALRRLAAVCVLLNGVALVMSTSRGAWLGAGLGLIFVFVSEPPLRRQLLLALGGLVTGTWLAVLAGVKPVVTVLELLASRVTSAGNIEAAANDDRPAIYAQAWSLWLQHPLVGVGTSRFEHEAQAAASAVRVVSPVHAHSLVFQSLAEGGLLGLTAVLAMVCCVVVVHRRLRRSGQPLTLAHLGGTALLVTAAGQGALDYPWTNAVLLVTVFLALGFVGHTADRPVVVRRGSLQTERRS